MPKKPKALMLFGAGFGTRMAPLTDRLPKPLIAVAGRPLLDRALDLAAGQGISPVVVNTHYRAEMIEHHLSGTGVITLRETPEILDTGGGLLNALPRLGDGPVFTLNSDAIWSGNNPLAELAAGWDPQRMDALLMLIAPGAANGHRGGGDFELGGDGRLRRGGDMIYSGAQIIQPGPVRAVGGRVFSLNRVWDDIGANGRLFGIVHRGGWCDVGQPASIPAAEAVLQEAENG